MHFALNDITNIENISNTVIDKIRNRVSCTILIYYKIQSLEI